jgi:uncharacterized membrane protein
MTRFSNFLHVFFALTVIFQISAITYIISAYNNPNVPIHFSFGGTADSLGPASEYYLLIGINTIVYILALMLGKFAKVNLQQYATFVNDEERKTAEQSMQKKIKLFLQTISANFSLFVTLLVSFLLINVINNNADTSIGSIGIIAFLVSSLVIVVLGLIWINKK